MELSERLQRLAVAAADQVMPGMVVGLGTGSTADAVTRELGRRVAGGLIFTAVPTSDRTEVLARDLGISLVTLDEIDRLDLGIDGADEIDPALDAIKGRGGALLREKLVALSCDDYVLVATSEKSVDRLGTRTPLPVEIVAFGWSQTAKRLARLGIRPSRGRWTAIQPDPGSRIMAGTSWTAPPDRSPILPSSPPPSKPPQASSSMDCSSGSRGPHCKSIRMVRWCAGSGLDGNHGTRGDRETFRNRGLRRGAPAFRTVRNAAMTSFPALAETMLSFASVDCRARAFR